jgi:hypothetical protein
MVNNTVVADKDINQNKGDEKANTVEALLSRIRFTQVLLLQLMVL